MKYYINLNKFFLILIFFLHGLWVCSQQSMVPPKRAHHALIYDDSKKQVMLFGGSTPVDGGNSAIFLNDFGAMMVSGPTAGRPGINAVVLLLLLTRREKKYFHLAVLRVKPIAVLNSAPGRTTTGRRSLIYRALQQPNQVLLMIRNVTG